MTGWSYPHRRLDTLQNPQRCRLNPCFAASFATSQIASIIPKSAIFCPKNVVGKDSLSGIVNPPSRPEVFSVSPVLQASPERGIPVCGKGVGPSDNCVYLIMMNIN
jgi:hypothetical protein